MQHAARLLCLLVALTGTPLRQAEAADDLSRALAGFFQPADIEPLDGGVGDDSGVGTLETFDPGSVNLGRDVEPSAVAPLQPLVPSHFDPCQARRWRERVPWPPTPGSRHHAWLQ